ncbi:hypothetical protein GGX14DRAFT_674316 [Mycena pura]|uniref:Uncharacterized protein n=1 Tax=Mycena pura TaxID=153505 RepID=A0AAD6UVA0_9AGAR|nr:hypothetical protein GGX14DRAFT_674316 [Mycena pura]
MLGFLSFAVLLVAAAAAPVTDVTLLAALTTPGNIVRIHDTSNLGWGVDPGYPDAPEFTPVNAITALPTTTPTNQDWILVPQAAGTFKIQSAMFPNMFISYASFGVDATNTPIHSQLVLRTSDNAAIFSLQTLSGGLIVNILIPAIGKVISSWTTTLADLTTPITVTNLQAGSNLMTSPKANAGNTKANGVNIDNWMRGTLRHFAGWRFSERETGAYNHLRRPAQDNGCKCVEQSPSPSRGTNVSQWAKEQLLIVRSVTSISNSSGFGPASGGDTRSQNSSTGRNCCIARWDSDGAAQRREDEDRTDVDAATWSIQDHPRDFKFCKDCAVDVRNTRHEAADVVDINDFEGGELSIQVVSVEMVLLGQFDRVYDSQQDVSSLHERLSELTVSNSAFAVRGRLVGAGGFDSCQSGADIIDDITCSFFPSTRLLPAATMLNALPTALAAVFEEPHCCQREKRAPSLAPYPPPQSTCPPHKDDISSTKENRRTRARDRPKATKATSSRRHAPLGDRTTNTNEPPLRPPSSPPPESESGRIARLEAELSHARAQRDSATAALRAQRERAPAPVVNTLPSTNASKVKMEDLQEQLGADSLEWNPIHTVVRDALSSAQLNPGCNWKAQNPSKLAMAYNAVEEKFLALRRCEGQYGVDRLAKQAWSNRKSYQTCVSNPGTYHGRRAAARRSPPCSPVAGPSQPHRRARLQRVDDEDDEDDGLMHFQESQDEGDGAEDEEELEMSRAEGKKRAAPRDGSNKRQRS